MKTKSSLSLTLLFFFIIPFQHIQARRDPLRSTCNANHSSDDSCQAYVFYRATPPDFLDLASVADLFSVSRLMISNPSNISSPASPLLPDQSLFVPIRCSCKPLNSSIAISYAGLNYTIKGGNTFYAVSTSHFQNLTTYHSVEALNPDFDPRRLKIGDVIVFPIFCKCPNSSQLANQVNYLITYVFQPSDQLSTVASRFGTTEKSIVDVNGNDIQPFDVVFVPVSRLPNVTQPAVPPPAPDKAGREGVITGLGIGLGVCGLLLILVCGGWVYGERKRARNGGKRHGDEEKHGRGKDFLKGEAMNLMADISGCLDKYKVFKIEELRDATDGFDERCLIRGRVYRGCIDGEVYAIKKTKWNAYEDLKILQKVNHGNLVRLEGFCIEPNEANCYLVYEYVEKGSLHTWLHENVQENLSWKTRLGIAIDVANGLQYIHEHTRPKVVHKDIKSHNILLDSNMRAKIANFGLAKSGCNAMTVHTAGTQGYIAPEYLLDGVVSTKMDVFSFGVVLLELVSGREAVDRAGTVLWSSTMDAGILEGKEEKKLIRLKNWMDDCFVHESCSMESFVNVMAVAMACLNKDPARRPSMVEVVYALAKSYELLFEVSEDGFSPRQVMAR